MAIAVALMVLLETLRASGYCGIMVEAFMEANVDDRDRGNALALTHVYLLAGCAAPLFTLMLNENTSTSKSLLLRCAGLLATGVGDTMGAVIGSKFGRWKWPASNRTVEGSLAMFMSLLLASSSSCSSLAVLHSLCRALRLSCFPQLPLHLEASTEMIDNYPSVMSFASYTTLLVPT